MIADCRHPVLRNGLQPSAQGLGFLFIPRDVDLRHGRQFLVARAVPFDCIAGFSIVKAGLAPYEMDGPVWRVLLCVSQDRIGRERRDYGRMDRQ